MPRKVQTIAELQSEIGQTIVNPRTKGFQKMKPKGGTAVRPLDALQRQALSMLKQKFYVYNVSPIFNWRKRASDVNFFIPKRRLDTRVSDVMVVLPAADKLVVKGEGVAEHVVTLGEDLVKAVLGITAIPNQRGGNLIEAGCFYTSEPLEKLPKEEQEALLDAAEDAHQVYCAKKVLEADEWWGDPTQKKWIVNKHRQCATFLGEERDWVSKRGAPKAPATKECPYCSYPNSLKAVLCFNCKLQIVSDEEFQAVKAGVAKVAK